MFELVWLLAAEASVREAAPPCAGPPRRLRRIWDWIRQNVLRLGPGQARRLSGNPKYRPIATADSGDAACPDAPPLEPARSVVRSGRAQQPGGAALAPIRSGLQEVPPLPHVVRELLRELSDPMSSARSVARIAASDPALGATLIRTVNSAAIGLRRKINNIQDAVSYLGYSTVRSLVIRMRLQNVMPTRPGQNAYDAEDLWVHSLAVAYTAEELAKRAGLAELGLVATLGLLHDIGKLAINSYFPDSAAQIRHPDQERASESFLERERRILGADHAELGAMLATHWKLPPDLVEAIRWHHAPEQAPAALGESLRRAALLVYIANQVAKYCYVYSDDMEIDLVPDEILRAAGLPAPMARLMGASTHRAISRAIFFADESSAQPLAAIRRFLRLSPESRAPKSAPPPVEPWRATSAQISTLDDDWAMQLSRDPARIDCTLLSGSRMEQAVRSAGSHVRLVARVVPGTVDRMLQAAALHLQGMEVEDAVRLPSRFVARRLIPNLAEIAPSERVELYQCVEKGSLLMAIHSPALAFARRFGDDTSAGAGRAVLQRELANILNLRWFRKISVTDDGATILLRGEASRL